jgi:dolichyl-diphosphooligosaccharide---protein glycosyltransferase
MVRIGGSTDRGAHIKEWDYYTPQGEFRVDKEGSPILLNCLMYKMCYYRFGQVYTEGGAFCCYFITVLYTYLMICASFD